MAEEIGVNNPGASFLYTETNHEDLFTPEDFTEEHRMIKNTAQQFVEKEVRPAASNIENEDYDTVIRLLHRAGDLGLLAHSIPEEYGGLGLDKISKGLVGEALGGTGGYGVAHSNHTCIATLPITYFGTPKQKERYLPKLASGEFIGAYCLTEPKAGSDALSSQTTANLNEAGTHYILNGSKLFITNAGFSDTFIVYAKINGEKFSAFIVEKTFPGVKLGQEEKKMGIKGSSTRPVFFEDCEVPIENLIGEAGKGHVIALNVLNLGRFNLGSACMGAAKHVLRKTIDYIKERRQFGMAIADFPATKEKIAQIAIRIYAAESLQYRTAHLLEQSLSGLDASSGIREVGRKMAEYATECAVCKVYGSETLDYTVDEALQLHGGVGYIKEYGIEKMYRDSRINRIFEGTNEINRLLIPTHLLRKALKGQLPLEEKVQKALLEMQTKPHINGNEPLGRERGAVQAIRRIFLVSMGLAYETFGAKLVEEQETLMKLADIGIELYATESAVLRSLKAIEKHGQENEKLKVILAEALVDEAILNVEISAKKLVNGIAQGTKRQQMNMAISSLLSTFMAEETIQRSRLIADKITSAGKFIC